MPQQSLGFRDLERVPDDFVAQHAATCKELDLTENCLTDFGNLARFRVLEMLVLDKNGINVRARRRCPLAAVAAPAAPAATTVAAADDDDDADVTAATADAASTAVPFADTRPPRLLLRHRAWPPCRRSPLCARSA